MKRIAIVLLLLALCLVPASAEGSAILGQPFPDFTATDTDGNTFTLSEALQDHEAALINLWATWCPPCEAEMPFLNEVYAQYGDRVAFIALSVESNDTVEEIEAYRQAHGIAFPMGRDEGSSLYRYLGGNGIPTTVIVDRFGNAAFLQVGCFFSANEVKRVIEAFLGDDYTQSVTLTGIPKDASTVAFPASGVTAIRLENEDAQPVLFWVEDISEPQMTYVIHDDTARLRLEVAASDNPAGMLCFDYNRNTYYALPDLLDPQRGVFHYDSAVYDAEEDRHYNYICLIDGDSDGGDILDGVYLLSGDEYIEEFEKDLQSWGYTVTWEYAESAPAEEAAPQAYILHVIDQYGAPVPGMMVNFCTDTACVPMQADEEGTISFEGAPDVYHVQLLKAPEGYSFDPDFEMYMGSAYGEWALRIRKD